MAAGGVLRVGLKVPVLTVGACPEYTWGGLSIHAVDLLTKVIYKETIHLYWKILMR